MVTAYGASEAFKHTPDTPISGILLKPVSPSTLFDSIMAAFGKMSLLTTSESQPQPPDLGMELASSIRGARILLVEDNEVNQEVAREMLERIPFVVDVAHNGLEAVDQVKSTTFDCVLMDIQMPEMDGYEATRTIRSDPGFANLPIIAMTANALPEDRQRCLDAGMNDYIAKPINFKQMFALLAKWITPGERQIPEMPPEATKPDADQPSLPELPGINTIAGLAKVGGNSTLYRNLLTKFANNQGNAVGNIESALVQNDLKNAILIAHTLKGTAGSISARALYEAAGNLEAALKTEQPVKELLRSTEEELSVVMESIGNLAPAEDGATKATLPTELLAPRLQELLEKLEQYDAESEELLESISAQTSDSGLKRGLFSLQKRIAQYDFESAAVELKELMEKHQTV
jgi:CheY-like chemotaxis protein